MPKVSHNAVRSVKTVAVFEFDGANIANGLVCRRGIYHETLNGKVLRHPLSANQACVLYLRLLALLNEGVFDCAVAEPKPFNRMVRQGLR